MNIRNRIKARRRIRAGALVPHEFNFRTHGDDQRAALATLYEQIGFARARPHRILLPVQAGGV